MVGDVQLAALRPEHLARVKSECLKTLAPSTTVLVRQVFVAALRWAEDAGLVTNVLALTRNRISRPPRVERRTYVWLNRETAGVFLAAAADSPYGLMYRVMLTLGLRVGELLGLRWVDIN